MKLTVLTLMSLLAISAVGFAKANGAWLQRVPAAARQRPNPYAGQPDSIAAGKLLYASNCSHCHGQRAEGKGSRPSLRSERIRSATDGDIAWLLKNGEAFKGMPSWSGLPEPERWQIIAYIRSFNP